MIDKDSLDEAMAEAYPEDDAGESFTYSYTDCLGNTTVIGKNYPDCTSLFDYGGPIQAFKDFMTASGFLCNIEVTVNGEKVV